MTDWPKEGPISLTSTSTYTAFVFNFPSPWLSGGERYRKSKNSVIFLERIGKGQCEWDQYYGTIWKATLEKNLGYRSEHVATIVNDNLAWGRSSLFHISKYRTFYPHLLNWSKVNLCHVCYTGETSESQGRACSYHCKWQFGMGRFSLSHISKYNSLYPHLLSSVCSFSIVKSERPRIHNFPIIHSL